MDPPSIITSSDSSVPSSPAGSKHSPISLADLVQPDLLITVDEKTPVANAFEIMEQQRLSCLPVRGKTGVYSAFDWTDLNAYLLLVLGRTEYLDPAFQPEIEQARRGIPASVGFGARLGVKDDFVRLPVGSSLDEAICLFGNGVHRIATINASNEITGILSQRRIMRYIHSNLRRFPSLEKTLDKSISELNIGTYSGMVTVQGDTPVLNAFNLMHDSAVSSVAVVDKDQNLLGNLSVADVALVTNSRNSALLQESCKHFLTVILDERGLVDGKDPVPVFFVDKTTKLRKAIAKMVATKAHRLWIIEPSADLMTSGKLIGVISLTDILHLFAGQSGFTTDPEAARRHRRSSSSSVSRSSFSETRKEFLRNLGSGQTSPGSTPATPSSSTVAPPPPPPSQR